MLVRVPPQAQGTVSALDGGRVRIAWHTQHPVMGQIRHGAGVTPTPHPLSVGGIGVQQALEVASSAVKVKQRLPSHRWTRAGVGREGGWGVIRTNPPAHQRTM